MNRWKKTFWLLAALTAVPAVCGCAIKQNYPAYPRPNRPEIVFLDVPEASNKDKNRVHCLDDKDLRALDEYVLRLEGLAKKYECEIQTINTGSCDALDVQRGAGLD